MREINTHKVNPVNDTLKITVMDEPGAGRASHHYVIEGIQGANGGLPVEPSIFIPFQNGTILENGVNGVTQEALMAIVIDRLRSFQAGKYACHENAMALAHFETGLMWLLQRTRDRMARGVEGTHAK